MSACISLANQQRFFINFGLYRDDGLYFVDLAKPVIYEKIRKDVFKIMLNVGLKITSNLGNQVINFLEVILSLSDVNFKPYRKPNCFINCINKTSNHPHYIKKINS